MFVDKAKIRIIAGNGGNGAVAFHREKYINAGGPDGGDGGRGGNIVFQVDDNLSTLADFRYQRKYKAQSGENGRGSHCNGKRGEDLIIKVPRGTVIKEVETGFVMADMSIEETFIAAKGGRGGWGNSHFKTATRQVPRFAKDGAPGEDWEVYLELKLLADVGLVGFPNAGKSTLLSTVSAAKPKIADYPFTTLEPNLGIVSYYDDKSFVMADIPGIIEGAHEGKGIGMRFLRHIERNSILLFMVAADEDDIVNGYEVLLNELREYNPELLVKDRVLAITKSDMLDEQLKKEIEAQLPEDIPHVFISSFTQEGIKELKDLLWEALQKDIEEQTPAEVIFPELPEMDYICGNDEDENSEEDNE